MLTISQVTADDPSMADVAGTNRFECRTCPYQMVLDKRYFERKIMKKKEVEDVLGGEGSWDNVDKTNGTIIPKRFRTLVLIDGVCSAMPE
jgi:DNA-directed RNA polymerase III subunit RPC11